MSKRSDKHAGSSSSTPKSHCRSGHSAQRKKGVFRPLLSQGSYELTMGMRRSAINKGAWWCYAHAAHKTPSPVMRMWGYFHCAPCPFGHEPQWK